MKLFLDATTVRNGRSGTGAYAAHMLAGLARPEGGHQVICMGDSRNPELSRGNQVRILHNASNPHLAINAALWGNRPGIYADGSFFPNFFMPPGWPWPAAVTIHDVSFITHPQFYSRKMTAFYRRRIRHTLSHARLILTVSQTSREQLIRHLDISPERIRVHIPCPATICRHSLPPQDKPYLVYIGNMEPRKNLLNLIQGYHKSNLRNTDLILIGKMHAPRSWAKRFHSLVNQTPGVLYKGYVSEAEMKRHLINSRGLVSLSYVEGFGMSQLDALTNGIPALISDDPAMKEVAQGHSLVTRPDDISGIANRLNDLVSLSRNPSENAAPYFRQLYSSENYHNKLEDIVRELAEKREPAFPGYGSTGSMLEQAIVAGICYAGVFSSGIHDDKLYHSLGVSEPDRHRFRTALSHIENEFPGRFQRNDRITALRSVDLRNRHAGHEQAENVRTGHRHLIRILGSWPWVRAVYYSGGTVHGSRLEKDPDLDLFIVSSAGRVWLVYTAIRLFSKITGGNHSFCCNYLVDEPAQEIHWQRDFYTAFQMLFLRQVLRKKGTRHIRQSNNWIYRFFPNAPQFEQIQSASPVKGNGFADWLNMLAMFLWTSRWRRKGLSNGTGGMLWDFTRIKLHANDHRPVVYRKYERLLNEGEVLGQSLLTTKARRHKAYTKFLNVFSS